MEPLFQKIEIDENRLFIAKNNIVPHFNNLFHFHPEYELTFLKKGNGHCLMGDRLIDFKEGDLFFMGANFPHSWRSDHSLKKSQSLVIQLNYQLWKGPIFEGSEMQGINKLMQASSRGIKFDQATSRKIARKMFEVLEGSPAEGLIKLFNILHELSESCNHEQLASPAFSPLIKQTDYIKINRVYQYVQDNFQKEISLADLSALIHMTPSGFCRYFKRMTRQTFFSYLNEYKIGAACRFLLTDEFNITEISFKSGFQSISNFNKQFKLITGHSPQGYRKKLSLK